MTPPNTSSPEDSALSALRDLHPGWNVWRSHGSAGMPGAFYATRTRTLTPAEAEAGVPATLGADTVEQLAGKLAADRDRENRHTM